MATISANCVSFSNHNEIQVAATAAVDGMNNCRKQKPALLLKTMQSCGTLYSPAKTFPVEVCSKKNVLWTDLPAT